MRIVAPAPGKVNLCLFVGQVRGDGRHEVLTLIESVSLADELSVAAVESGTADEVLCPGVSGSNIVGSALEGLRARGWNAPPVRVEIVKRIPVAGGMGGGSADAGAILRTAPRLAPISDRAVSDLAAQLGADVPSQLDPGLAIGVAAGEQVERAQPVAAHALVIVPQEQELSTAEVYAEADRIAAPRGPEELARLGRELREVLGSGGRLPPGLLVNDLQPAALSLCPSISEALDALVDAGADHAMVSGSGPTAFGIFWGRQCVERAHAAEQSLHLRAISAVPWDTASDIHGFRHNLGTDR